MEPIRCRHVCFIFIMLTTVVKTTLIMFSSTVLHRDQFVKACAPENHNVHKVFINSIQILCDLSYSSCCFASASERSMKTTIQIKTTPSSFSPFYLLIREKLSLRKRGDSSEKTRKSEATAIKTLGWRLHKAAAGILQSFTRWTSTKLLGFFFFVTYFLWSVAWRPSRCVGLDWLPVRLAQSPLKLHFPHPHSPFPCCSEWTLETS